MPYIVEGEPRVFISEQGAEIEFRGGQPVMDAATVPDTGEHRARLDDAVPNLRDRPPVSCVSPICGPWRACNVGRCREPTVLMGRRTRDWQCR